MKEEMLKIAIALMIAGMAAGFHDVRTINIKADGSGDYPTIQAGIDATVDGDNVVVWPGTYQEE